MPSTAPPDLVFYEGYDPYFILKKAVTLLAIYKNAPAFAELTDSWGCPIKASDEEHLGAIATEIHCSVFHQSEALLALLLAEHHPLPHWVYLTTYSNAEIKTAAQNIDSGNFSKMTNGKAVTMEDLVCGGVFSGIRPSGDDEERWKQSVEDIGWLIGQVAQLYIAGNEYNSYKHGLRVVSGSCTFAVKPTNREEFSPIISMRHSLTYLELYEELNGYTAQRVTKELNPEYSFAVIDCVAQVLWTIRQTRIARITRDCSSLFALTIDREKLSIAKPVAERAFRTELPSWSEAEGFPVRFC